MGERKAFQTDKAAITGGLYSQAVIHNGLIYLSGQGPIDPQTNEVTLGTVEKESELALENIRIILEEAGSSLNKILQVTVYLLDMKEYGRFNEVRSSSTEGMSSIIIELVAGTDINEVLSKTKDKVDLAKPDLPADLEEDPDVIEVNISELPIVVLSLTGTVGLVRLKEIAEELQDDIESIPGVLEAEVTGGLEQEIRVEPDPGKLAYYGLSILSLQSIIAEENQNVSGGPSAWATAGSSSGSPASFRAPRRSSGPVKRPTPSGARCSRPTAAC